MGKHNKKSDSIRRKNKKKTKSHRRKEKRGKLVLSQQAVAVNYLYLYSTVMAWGSLIFSSVCQLIKTSNPIRVHDMERLNIKFTVNWELTTSLAGRLAACTKCSPQICGEHKWRLLPHIFALFLSAWTLTFNQHLYFKEKSRWVQ